MKKSDFVVGKSYLGCVSWGNLKEFLTGVKNEGTFQLDAQNLAFSDQIAFIHQTLAILALLNVSFEVL